MNPSNTHTHMYREKWPIWYRCLLLWICLNENTQINKIITHSFNSWAVSLYMIFSFRIFLVRLTLWLNGKCLLVIWFCHANLYGRVRSHFENENGKIKHDGNNENSNVIYQPGFYIDINNYFLWIFTFALCVFKCLNSQGNKQIAIKLRYLTEIDFFYSN